MKEVGNGASGVRLEVTKGLESLVKKSQKLEKRKITEGTIKQTSIPFKHRFCPVSH